MPLGVASLVIIGPVDLIRYCCKYKTSKNTTQQDATLDTQGQDQEKQDKNAGEHLEKKTDEQKLEFVSYTKRFCKALVKGFKGTSKVVWPCLD